MQQQFVQLIRNSFVRPRDAARYLIGLSLSTNVLIQAALLRSVLSVLAWSMMTMTMLNMSTDLVLPEDISPLVNVLLGLASIFLTSFIVVQFARLLGVDISFNTSTTVYIWFGVLESGMMIFVLLAMYVVGSGAALLFVGASLWGVWVMALFWSELLGGKNVFVALTVIVGASLITVFVMGLVAGSLGLAVTELPIKVENS